MTHKAAFKTALIFVVVSTGLLSAQAQVEYSPKVHKVVHGWFWGMLFPGPPATPVEFQRPESDFRKLFPFQDALAESKQGLAPQESVLKLALERSQGADYAEQRNHQQYFLNIAPRWIPDAPTIVLHGKRIRLELACGTFGM
jgi:hypothetical protein